MCGIAGFYTPDKLPNGDIQSNINAMLNKLVHRGPDAFGVWADKNNTGVVLGHRRLSIIDLTETGSQPMMSHSGRYVISFNGEIYNTGDLKKYLFDDGYRDAMNGTSDTEILLESCSHFGIEESLNKCKGMFAFALYDRETKELVIARDRIGEKPLYYGYVNGAFVFASELPAIRALNFFDADIDNAVLPFYMRYGYIPAPYSIYKNIWKLEPGSILKIKCEVNKYTNFEKSFYWKITDIASYGQAHLFKGSRQEAANELEKILKDSIKKQMISDVPLGAFLSAGIDSSTVVSIMQAVSDKPIRTFTIGFGEKEYNEADDAAKIAGILGTEHTRMDVSEAEAMDAIPLMSGIFGEPFGDSSQIPTYLVSKLTRQHVTVALSGDGGDELFGGYRSYFGISSIYNKIKNIPYPLRVMCGGLMRAVPGDGAKQGRIRAHGCLLGAKGISDLYLRTYETWKDGGLDLISDEALDKRYISGSERGVCEENPEKFVNDNDPFRVAMLTDMQCYHPDDILVKVDRSAMAVSLETRVPMLYPDVVEFAWTLPTEYMCSEGKGKAPLRDVLYRYVDRSLMERPKKGFSVPVSVWLKDGRLKKWAEELLNSDSINKHNILDSDQVLKMWNDYIDHDIWRPQIWYTLMLCDWLEGNL
ncbi:MAG: asparagine synthase (glutamine-hydrolyzing) [Lachnospiraceae bacterium]|nr:asparagine synthase (glutamine-hydrolyzing) [Lachnospiraceae bacterium]